MAPKARTQERKSKKIRIEKSELVNTDGILLATKARTRERKSKKIRLEKCEPVKTEQDSILGEEDVGIIAKSHTKLYHKSLTPVDDVYVTATRHNTDGTKFVYVRRIDNKNGIITKSGLCITGQVIKEFVENIAISPFPSTDELGVYEIGNKMILIKNPHHRNVRGIILTNYEYISMINKFSEIVSANLL
jgi:hypothetical protein